MIFDLRRYILNSQLPEMFLFAFVIIGLLSASSSAARFRVSEPDPLIALQSATLSAYVN